MKILKWTTISEYVDEETGEMISKEQMIEEYIIKRKIKKTTTHEKYNRVTKENYTEGVVTITNECRRKYKQLKLW